MNGYENALAEDFHAQCQKERDEYYWSLRDRMNPPSDKPTDRKDETKKEIS
jgi:hypothetical protein